MLGERRAGPSRYSFVDGLDDLEKIEPDDGLAVTGKSFGQPFDETGLES
jgi:hypothetical protein